MDEYASIKSRIKSKRQTTINQNTSKKKVSVNIESKYIKNLFTRTLISVILVLLVSIYINISDQNLLNFNNYFFKETLEFTKINNLYSKYFGDILPDKGNKTLPVFNEPTTEKNIEPFNQNSYAITLSSNTFSYLESGIVVFYGEKENLGKTIIIQGIDGTDIWYSNLESSNITLYDYVEKNSIIGVFKENKPILTFMENGNYISYEKYFS